MKKQAGHKMVTSIFSVFFLASTLLLSATSCYAQDKTMGRVTKTVNLRTAPGANSKSLGVLAQGYTVEVIEISNGWAHVLFKGLDSRRQPRMFDGYLSMQFIETYVVEDNSKYEKVEGLNGTEERSSIGCTNISPLYDADSHSTLLIDATSADYDSVIKMIRKSDGKCIRMVYVRSGTTHEVRNIPFDHYYLRVASGIDMRKKNVDGKCSLVFVSNARYIKTNDEFHFFREEEPDGFTDAGWQYILKARVKDIDAETVSQSIISEAEFNR